MTLEQICAGLLEIKNGLAYGAIRFTTNQEMNMHGTAHPADELDELIEDIQYLIMRNQQKGIRKDHVESMLEDLQKFQKRFQVAEMEQPLNDLQKLVESL